MYAIRSYYAPGDLADGGEGGDAVGEQVDEEQIGREPAHFAQGGRSALRLAHTFEPGRGGEHGLHAPSEHRLVIGNHHSYNFV